MVGVVRRRAAGAVAAVAALVVMWPGMLAGTSASAAVAGGTEVAGASTGTWGKAIEVPGIASLNAGGYALIYPVSCGSAGNCSAGGFYTDGSGHKQAFVVSEVSGTWGTAIEVPGTAALNTGGNAQIYSVSCASAGNCLAGGFYAHGTHQVQAFVVSEVSGKWGNAEQVRGTAALNLGGDAVITSVSCVSAGNCSAGGSYSDATYQGQAFVVSEVNGKWDTAEEVPDTGSLNAGGDAAVGSVSCVSAGNCSAGGYYTDGSGNAQVFVVGEVSGKWGNAEQVPGSAALSAGEEAQIPSVSCVSAGNCSAGGYYTDGSGNQHAFVVSEVSGKWGNAEQVPGTVRTGGNAEVASVSCVSAGNCSAGGYYDKHAFVASEVSGKWGNAEQVPGTGTGTAGVGSVSCVPAGNCSVSGYYTPSAGSTQAFVAREVNGTWGTTEQVPGSAALNTGGNADTTSVSCVSAGNCSAVGYYTGKTGLQVFVVSETPAAPLRITATSLPPGTAGSAYNATLSASGGTPPYAWSLATGSNALPAGLSLSPGGHITGTPTAAGTTTIIVQVADSGSPLQTATEALSLVINAAGTAQPDLNISLHPRGVFRHGRNATYQVRVHNAGNATAKREKAAVHLPSGMTRQHVHSRGWRCRAHGHTEICVHHGHLRPHHSATFYLHIHITARKGRKLTTTARVTPAGSDTNNTAKSTVRIR